jgi:uncharacterized protein (TIGR03437 family)
MGTGQSVLLVSFSVVLAPHAAGGVPRPEFFQGRSLVFEERARPDQSPSFTTQRSGVALQLRRDGADIEITGKPGTSRSNLEMRVVGGLPAVDPQGEGATPGTINFLVGCESQWRRGITAYNSVRYASIYRGIDLIFYGNQDRLEYDFAVAPGADPSKIQMQWNGARKLSMDRDGSLIVTTDAGNLRWNAPLLYQESSSGRRRISGGFRLLSYNRVAFRIGHYDSKLALVIDPTLVFATYLGGSGVERPRGIAVDGSGNVYVTGFTNSMNLPVTGSAFQTGYAGGTTNKANGDAFVAKYSSTGALIFLTYLGGSKDDIAIAVAADSVGSAYVTGYTNSADFPVTSNGLQKTFGGYVGSGFALRLGDAFVTKLSPDGKSLVYSTYLGGSSDDGGFAIALDGSNNAYVTGTTLSRNFPTTSGAYQTTYQGSAGQENFPLFGSGLSAIVGGDVFIAKINPTGSALIYSTLLGGNADDIAATIAVDGSGNAYVGGYTLSRNFPTTSGAFQTAYGGTEQQNFFFNFGDGFISKINSSGTALVYSTLIGGRGDDWVSSLLVDPTGSVYATGSTTSDNFPTKAPMQTSFYGPTTLPQDVDMFFGDAFVLKLNAAGTGLVFSTFLGGSGDDCGMSIALDGAGNIIVGGLSNSMDFPVTSDAFQPKLAGPGFISERQTFGDGFIFQLSANGASKMYGTYIGGTGDDAIFSIALAPSGTLYFAGSTVSSDFPVKSAAQPNSGGTSTSLYNSDAFVGAISGFTGTNTGTGPFITAVLNASGEGTAIGQNTWVEIKGGNLSKNTRIWAGPDFVNNQMPTSLDGVSVTVNGKTAFVYYIDSKQVNILTPLDSTTGPVQVQLTNNSVTSPAVSATMQTVAPGFFQFGAGPYVAAVHLDGTFVGPTSLYPGLSSPARAGETIELFANGFGQTSPAVVNGSAAQNGALPAMPVVKMGSFIATVQFAGVVAPGEYQFNVTVPTGLPAGDVVLSATYGGATTQPAVLITVK